jgi:hypothetical protein
MSEKDQAVPKLYDFIQWLIPQIAKFPRSHKFTLGDRIINLALDTLQLLIKATYRKQKVELLQDANLNLEQLRYLIRLCKDLNLLNLKSYEYASKQINEVGKLIGGWIKQQQGRRQP